MKRYSVLAAIAATGILSVCGASAHAAFVQVPFSLTGSWFTCSGSDLINNGSLARTASFDSTGFSQQNANLIANGDSGANGNTGAYAPGTPDPTATYYLDTLTNTKGYDITKIDLYGGYGTSLAGYGNLDVTVSYRLVGSSTFQTLGQFTYANGTATANKLSVTETSGTLVSGIDALKFSFAGDDSAIPEVDAFGAATSVPEPTSLALIGVVGLGLMRRRRHALMG